MKRLSLRTRLVLAVDAALLVICILHISQLLDRPRIPFDATESNGSLLVREIVASTECPQIRVGDTIRTWNKLPIATEHEVEFLTDFLSIGDSVWIAHTQNSVTRETQIRLIAAHNVGYVILMMLVGFVACGVGVFIVISSSRERAATVLHWSLVMMGVNVMITWGQVLPDHAWMYISRPLFFIVYAGVAATFVHFTTLFPRSMEGSVLLRNTLIYLPMLLLASAMIYYHLGALRSQTLDHFNRFQELFDIFHIALVVYVGIGIIRFIISYRQSVSPEEQKKLKWILWGLTLGPLPFFFLTIIPQYYLPFGFVPEEYTLVFLGVIPLAFGISFVKYHLLDIEIVINRTTVYGIVLSVLVAMYGMIVEIVTTAVGSFTVGTSAVVAVVIALVFEPVRKRVQHVVDKNFFRVQYNFRETLRRFSYDIKMCVDSKQLGDLLITRTQEFMPVERIAVFLLRQSDMRLFVLSQQGFELLERRTVQFHAGNLRTQLQIPVALDSKIEAGVEYESADPHVFSRWGMALVFPMKSVTGEVLGFLVLGSKKSGQRFSIEDVDLLGNVVTEAGVEFERIALQRKLVEEQAEKQRIAEVSQLKSDFVSNVSHELRTPLTSIKMYAEMLDASSRPSVKKLHSYLQTIVGEADRLDRLVTNILDSAKIERGAKEYHRQETDLGGIVSRVLTTMKYQIDKHGITLRYKTPRRPLPINGDNDAIGEAIMNVVDNAIKYSVNQKVLTVSLSRKGERVFCTVRDKGCGISPEALPHLFEMFYRDPASSASVQGVGLGLPLVKHILEEHGGGVDVSSIVGKGSTFTLWMPINRIVHEQEKKNSRR